MGRNVHWTLWATALGTLSAAAVLGSLASLAATPAQVATTSDRTSAAAVSGSTEPNGITDPAQCPAHLAGPTYRPREVSAQTTQCLPGLYVITYTLSGPSNTRAVPPGVQPKDWPLDGSVHPASQISFSAASGYTSLPAPMATPTYYDITPGRFGQTTVRVTAPKSGYGPYRLEWLKAGTLYTIIAVRGVTNTGPSGVPLEDLGRMADSVR